jgi:hypothetical protein
MQVLEQRFDVLYHSFILICFGNKVMCASDSNCEGVANFIGNLVFLIYFVTVIMRVLEQIFGVIKLSKKAWAWQCQCQATSALLPFAAGPISAAPSQDDKGKKVIEEGPSDLPMHALDPDIYHPLSRIMGPQILLCCSWVRMQSKHHSNGENLKGLPICCSWTRM